MSWTFNFQLSRDVMCHTHAHACAHTQHMIMHIQKMLAIADVPSLVQQLPSIELEILVPHHLMPAVVFCVPPVLLARALQQIFFKSISTLSIAS